VTDSSATSGRGGRDTSGSSDDGTGDSPETALDTAATEDKPRLPVTVGTPGAAWRWTEGSESA